MLPPTHGADTGSAGSLPETLTKPPRPRQKQAWDGNSPSWSHRPVSSRAGLLAGCWPLSPARLAPAFPHTAESGAVPKASRNLFTYPLRHPRLGLGARAGPGRLQSQEFIRATHGHCSVPLTGSTDVSTWPEHRGSGPLDLDELWGAPLGWGRQPEQSSWEGVLCVPWA